MFHSEFIKSMLKNTFIRPISMLLNIIYTPLLLGYLGSEKYGLWVTILSIINWVNFCDIGIGNGLRNVLTEELVHGQKEEIKKSISTAYVTLGILAGVLSLVLIILTLMIDWKNVMNTKEDITAAVMISFICIAVNFVFGIGKSILYAMQLSEIVSFLNLTASVIQFLGILILRMFGRGSLIVIALLFGLSSGIVFLICDLFLACKYPYFMPDFQYFSKNKVKILWDMGIIFLFLQLGGIVMSSTDNLLISRYFGPETVTPYSSVTRFFTAIESVYIAMISPVWSRTAMAFSQKDYKWIGSLVKKLNLLMAVIAASSMAVSIFYPQISRVWLGTELVYQKHLIPITALCCIFEMCTMTYSSILNGMNLLRFQVVVALIQSVLNIPMSIFLSKFCNLEVLGIKLATLFLFVFSAAVYYMYLLKNVNERIKE